MNLSQSTLFQDGGDTPLFAPGGMDQLSGYADNSQVLGDGWEQHVSPLLDAMQDGANSPQQTTSFDGFDDNTQKQLNDYLNEVRGQMATTKHAAIRYGEMQRNDAF